MSSSDIFEKELENSDSYSFASNVDDLAAKNLIKFLYTGILEYSNESDLVLFMILANVMKIKNIGEFKVPPKVYLNGIIAYIEKDLNARVGEFDSLAESVNFKKLEKEDLTKLYGKKKWLQKSSSFLNLIIMKDLDSEDGGSDKDSEASDEEEKEEDEDEAGGECKAWDKKLSNQTYYTYQNKDKQITYSGNTNWLGTAIGKKSSKYSLKMGTNCTYCMLGMADPKKINKSASNYNGGGHFYYPSGSSLYGTGNIGSFQSSDINSGTVYGFAYDSKKER